MGLLLTCFQAGLILGEAQSFFCCMNESAHAEGGLFSGFRVLCDFEICATCMERAGCDAVQKLMACL